MFNGKEMNFINDTNVQDMDSPLELPERNVMSKDTVI